MRHTVDSSWLCKEIGDRLKAVDRLVVVVEMGKGESKKGKMGGLPDFLESSDCDLKFKPSPGRRGRHPPRSRPRRRP